MARHLLDILAPSEPQSEQADDSGVGIGIYAAVLQAMWLFGGLGTLADPANDITGQCLSAAALSQRGRIKRRKPLSVNARPDGDG